MSVDLQYKTRSYWQATKIIRVFPEEISFPICAAPPSTYFVVLLPWFWGFQQINFFSFFACSLDRKISFQDLAWNFEWMVLTREIGTGPWLLVFLIANWRCVGLKVFVDNFHSFSNFSCKFLVPNIFFFQFEF